MLFNEAVTQLTAGNYVQRKAWEPLGEYVVLMPGMQFIWKILTQPNPNAGNWMASVADLLADDWEVIEKVSAPAPATPAPAPAGAAAPATV